jgi:predicted small lipoprotein YifL
MQRRVIVSLVSIAAAIALAACDEKPPRPDPERKTRYSNQAPQNPAHERTLNQGEAERIGN